MILPAVFFTTHTFLHEQFTHKHLLEILNILTNDWGQVLIFQSFAIPKREKKSVF